MIKDIIAKKTVLLPNIIAQSAVWDYLEANHKDLTPEQCYNIEVAIVPKLEDRANVSYQKDKTFKALISDNERGRDNLHRWFMYWCKKMVTDYLTQKINLVD
jgi:hypothetical protein